MLLKMILLAALLLGFVWLYHAVAEDWRHFHQARAEAMQA